MSNLDDDVVGSDIVECDGARTKSEMDKMIERIGGFADETLFFLQCQLVTHGNLLKVDRKHESRIECELDVCKVAPSPWQKRRIDGSYGHCGTSCVVLCCVMW